MPSTQGASVMRRSGRSWMVSVCQTGRARHEPNHDRRSCPYPSHRSVRGKGGHPHPRGWHSNQPGPGPCSTGPRLPQSGPLLGLVEGLCRKETVGITSRTNTTLLRPCSSCEGSGGCKTQNSKLYPKT